MNGLLKIKNLSKIFGPACSNCISDNPMLDYESNRCPICGSIIGCININLDVYPGEILGIVGESGSGKSTILNCIYFNYDVTAGQVFYRGYKNGSENILNANAQIKRSMQNVNFGIVYQNPYFGLNYNVSGEGNVAERLLVAGERHYENVRAKVHRLFERVEFPSSRYKDLPKYFSGGMQQRIQIAKALVSNPSLILLDEPTGGLDVSVQARILDLIRSISREMKVAMIMVSHDMQVIRLLCERIVVMRYGRIVEQGITDRVIDDPLEEYTQILVHSTL